ncbi:MAG: ATP-binding protein, partial [Saprospiraceae bacterium]|nr:ATP-binding protein [Saprospiraceae bacterium]
GLPGSGKDTIAEKLDMPVVSLDQIRQNLGIKHDDKNGQGSVAQAAYKQAKTFGAKKQSFVWNSTNLTTDMRNRLIHALSVYNPRFRIVYVETSMANIEHRRAENIPMDRLRALQNKLDMPLPEEAHVVEYGRN